MEVVYNTINRRIQIFMILEVMKIQNKVNKIGKILSNLEMFQKANNVLNIKISRNK